MGLFSKKTREEFRILIFRALESSTGRFVDFNRKVPLSSSTQTNSAGLFKKVASHLLLLLLVIAIGGVSIKQAYSQAEDRDTQLGVKTTLHIYPESVRQGSWEDVGNVLSPDLDEEALYQEFSQHNSAHVPLHSDNVEENSTVQPEVIVPEESPSGQTQQTSDTSATTSESFEDLTTPESVQADVVTEEVDESAPQEIPSEPEPEPESEPEPATETSAPESAQPVALKKATESFFAFLGTVTEFFPFMNDAEVTQDAAVVQTQEPEAAPEEEASQTDESESTVEPEPQEEVEETQMEQQPATDAVLSPEEGEPLESVPGNEPTSEEIATSSTELPPSSESAEDAGVQENNVPAESDTPLAQYAFTLSDFSAPELKRGEFIKSMQLRMSLAGSYDVQGSSSAPVLEIYYKTPSSTQQVGTVIVDSEVSNALNGGYFLFALPQIANISELNEVEVEVIYKGDTAQLDGMYVDTAWLQIEVEHLDKDLLQARLMRDLLKRLSDPSMYTLLSDEVDFTREELPHFNLKYSSQRNIAVRFIRDLFGRKLAEIEDVSFLHKDIGDIGITPEIDITDDGLINIQLEEDDKDRLRPGEYLVEITINEGGATYTDTFAFQWGLLSINSDQTSYALGDTAVISMGALSPSGNTICDADLSLYVIDPQEVLFKVPVAQSGLCNGNNVIDVPDYSATFIPEIEGEYEMYLERIDADGTIIAHTVDTFLVEEVLPFELSRKGPSRIYPKASYPMEISLFTNDAWEGTLIEQVPSDFEIMDTDAQIIERSGVRELVWDVALGAGETKTFTYTFDAPDISPYLYTLGTARLEGIVPPSIEQATSTVSESQASSTTQATSTEESVPEPIETEPEVVPEILVPPEIIPEAPVASTSESVETETSSNDAEASPEMVETSMEEASVVPETELQQPSPMESVVATIESGVLFEEHRQWQIASDATGNLIVFWDSAAAIPAGWTCLSCGSGTFYQRFPMGGDTYNTTGGATTHTHTATGVVNASTGVNTENNGSGEISIPSHSHLYTPTISTVSNLPAYRQYRVIQNNSAGDPATIPAGAIMMFDDATLPSGWTRLSALDGRYLRGENSIANGSSNTHTHSISGNTTAASNVSTLNSRTGGFQVTGAADNHAHSVSTTTASLSIEPPYIEVVFATAASATSTPIGAIAMWSDEPPAQWIDRSSQPTDPFNGRFVKGATSYGTTGGSDTHNHADIFSIISGNPTVTDNARSGASGSSNTHTHAVDVTNFTTTSHLPPYLTVVYGKKLGAVPVYTQTSYRFYVNENANTPSDPWPVGGADLLENEPITSEDIPLASGDVVRMRMLLGVTNSTSTADVFKLQYASTTALCTDASTWSDVGSATSSSAWRGYENAGVSDGATLATSTLSSTTVLASYEENNPTVAVPNPIGVGDYGEWDFVVQQNNAEAGTTYCFRMVEQDGTPLFAYSDYPTVQTNEAPNAPTLVKLFDNEKVSTTTPEFEFSAADTETDDLEYQIQIDNDYDFSSAVVDHNTVTNATLFENLATPADKDPFTNGELIRYNSATALSNGTTYYWRVRARDPNGSNAWGSWATIQSFTIDTSVTVSTWFQTTEEQFETNTLLNVEAVASDQMQILSPFATGTVYSDPITFEEGELGTAWGEFVFADTETSSDVKYTIQYNDNDTWTDIPDTDLPGNSSGFDTSPVSLLGVDKTVYTELRIEANLTDSGASPSIQSWSVDWDYLIETPTISAPFANEKVGTTTPTFQFTTTDPQSDDLIYQIQWSTSYDFSASTTRTSNTHAGFTNVDNGADTSPFTSGDDIRFKIQAGDALTNGTTYWWRVRARDPLGSNTYSFYTTPRSFTVDTTVTVSTWFQTTQSQFDNDLLSGLYTQAGGALTVATTSDESILVYAEGTVTTPRYRRWSGTAWGSELSALDVGATINWVVTKSSPIANEYITGTLGSDGDVNLQVFSNGAWGNLEEISTAISNNDMRGFDIAYESDSGDALAVACDGNADPSYHIWDGSSWSDEGDIDLASTGACGWVRLISDPTSDEIIIITRDTVGTNYEAQVWDGSSWGDGVTWGSMSEDINEGIAASYEESGGQAVVAVSNGGGASFSWRAWNGSTWTAAATVALGDDFEWGSMASDVGSDNMALCYVDNDTDIGVVRWTGAAWTGQTELDTAGNSKNSRPVDCMFEVGGSRDGYIMVAYSDTTAVRYRSWNGGSWAAEATISTISDASTIQLQRTGVHLLQLMAFDDVNDRYDYSDWNGTSWSTRQALETNGSVGAAPFKEPFMIGVQNPASFGTVTGDPLINFSEGSGPYWQQMSWTDTTTGGSDILYQVEYYDGDSWELIPDSLIPGNSTGTSTGPIDLTNVLPASTYDQIRPVATLSCNAGTCPILSDWTITWAAGLNVSGTAQQYDQSTNLTSGTVAIAVNGVLQSGKTGTIAAGVWSITNVNVAQDDVVTVFLAGAGDSSEAVAVTTYDGVGDVSGLSLFTQHLSLGSDDNASLSNASLALYDFTNDEDIFSDVNAGNDLSVCATSGCDDAVLYIKAGTTYQPGTGANVTTHGFENNGTFLPNGNTIRVSGSWENNATTTMATSSVIFTATTTQSSVPWYDSQWSHRLPLTVQSSQIDTSVTDFPVYVDLSDLDSIFFSNVNSDGGDIRVTNADGQTELPREIVSIDTGAETGEIHFQADSLSSSGDTTFYIYFGNSSASDYATNGTYGAENVWNNSYEAVYHFEEDPSGSAPQYDDSTGNSAGTAVNMEGADQVAGIAGNAAEVDGANESIQTNFNQALLRSTWSLFLNADGTQGACDGAMFSRGANVSGINLGACGATGEIGYHWNDSATTYNWANGPAYPTDEWFLASLVVEPTQATVYAHAIGGVTSGSNVVAHATSTINNLDFAWDSFGVARSFDGTIDEARLSSVARAEDWLDAEYRNISSPGTFYSVSASESYASSTSGLPYVLSDADGFLDFYNLTFGEVSGTSVWQLQDALDVENTLTVAYGTLARGSENITVAGNLTTQANGLWTGIGTTTFDGTSVGIWSDSSSPKQDIGYVVVNGVTKVVQLGSNVEAASITIGADDTFDLSTSNYDIVVNGNWINNHTFNPRNGDVTFSGTTAGQVITVGGDNFYNLIFNGAGGSWSFTEGTLSINNDLTIVTGTITLPTGTTTISGSFNNSGGTFAHNNAMVYFNSSAAETLTLNGGTFTNAFYNVRFQGSGSWAFTEANATTTNQFRIAQGNVTLPSGTLTVGDSFLNTGGTFTHNSGTVRFTSSGAETIDTNSSFNNLSFVGSGSWSFIDASVTALGDLIIDSGTLTLPSGTLSLGGSLSNNATLSHNNGTVLFNSGDTGETISLGTSPLYNMTFNGAGGGWTINSHATTTNNTTITAANAFTLASSQRLSVGGTFTNSVGGAATTWTGSTLSLEAGSYSLNAKANSGDIYETLLIKPNTDIRMWNSSAGTYTVDASSSLYSQDHAGVDGDLYIYGNYPRTSGTEYWSYATDFDGTSLGTTSRQVDVRFASGASADFIDSTVHIVGGASATTTIANQGSGTYTLSINGGTTTAQYYSFTDLAASGVTLQGDVAVTSLANGSFVPAVNTGTALTISSTTIDANPGLQIFNVQFATSTAITASNVTQQDGVPSSYWWFRSSSGNLGGETHDNDNGDPGSIRWDDSSLVFTVAGTVYADNGVTPLAGGTCDGVATPVRVVVENGGTFNGSCSALDGSYSIPNVVAIGDPTLTVFLNDASGGERAVVVTKTPTQDILDLDLYANRIITRHEDTAAMTISDMVYDSTDDSDVLFTAVTGAVPTLDTVANSELYVWATTTFTPGGAVTLHSGGTGNAYDGSLYISNGATFTGAGTTTYSVGGTFALADGATFVSASSTVLMTATTSGKAITAASGESITFNLLRFTGLGGGWNINGDITALDEIEVATGTVTGTGDISIPNGSFYGEGLVSLGGGTTTLERSNTLGGSQGWTLFNVALGNGSDVGTTTPASTATTTISGTLSIATAHFLDAGASHFDFAGTGTVFVENGTFLEDTSTVRYSGGGATNLLSTTYYDLELNAGAGTPTYTATGLGIMVLNDLAVGGDSTTSVTFDTNDTALDVNGTVLIRSNGTLIGSGSGSFTVGGDWDNNGVYTSSNGTVVFDGAGTVDIAAGNSAFGNLTVDGIGTFTVSEHATTTGAFTLASTTSSFTLASGQNLAIGGSFTNELGGGATTWTGSTLRFVSGTNYAINAKTISDTYETLAVGANTDIRMWNSSASSYQVNSSGSLYSQDHAGVDGDLYIYGNYSGNGGTDYWSYATDFDGVALGGSSRQAEVRFQSGANMTLLSGGLQVLGSPSASTTLQNQGSGTYGLLIGGSASTSWTYYDVEDTNSSGLTFSGSPNVVTLSRGDFEVSQSGGSAITVGGTAINANPAKTFTNNNFSTTTGISAFNVTATGTSVSSWRFTNHTGTLDGEQYDVDPDGDPGYIVWDNSAANITISGNVYSDEGTTVSGVCDGTTNNIIVRVAGLTSYTSSCNATTGLYSVSGVTYSPGDSIVAYIDGETQKGATVTEDPVSNINNMHIYENRVIARHEGTDSLSIADMAVWDSSDDADIPFTAVDGSPDTLTLPSDRKLIVWTGKEFEPNGNITLSGGGAGAAYDGTFEAQANAIVTFAGTQLHSVGGSFILGNGATFDAGLSTTTFTTTGAARTIDVNEEGFYNVSFTGSGSWSVSDATLDANNLFITAGVLTFPTGTTTISGSLSNNGGSFTINGSTLVFDATTSGNVVRAGGSNFEELIFNGVGGSWSMTDTNATTTGSLTVTSGTLTLPSGNLAVGGNFRNTGGAVTHNTADLYLTNASGATLLASSSDLYAVIFNGAGTFTMEDESLALLDDLRITQGSVTLASGTLSVGGSFDASGGSFNSASGTILFNSTDAGETIDPGLSSFYNVVLANATGGWTIVDHATTTNNFTLSLASSFTQQSGSRLYVGNVFTNSVGGSATTWTGTTLVLDAGAEYSINTKSSGGDQYQTLVVGANTDIRSWNSSATTTDVNASGSFYSQDHGGSNGALNIYGDFHISTTTEYWSYATDFDGTSLAGSERAVTVSIAANATTTIDGGTLNMLGASGNTTTVQNQGSGIYAFAVSDGTFNGLYYRYRNLNADGLLFSDTPMITSLSQGDFELAVNGGSLITLSSTTLDANASKVITGNRFATTSAITGSNVTLIGTTTNAWTFVSHTGNLSGEDFDDDGATACGSIRWSNSSCLLTQQTHYRWRHDDGGIDVPNSEWFNASWDARIQVRLENPDVTSYTDAVVKLEVPYDGAMQTDFGDLRFTDASGTTTIPHFVERYTASTDADVWVQVPVLAGEDITSIFMYFDNATASSTSSSTQTFIVADDFEDGNISEYTGDTSLFAVDGTFAYGGSYGLDATGHESDKATDGIARTALTVSQGQIIRYMQYVDTSAGSGDEVCTLFAVQSPVTANQNYAVCLEQFGVDRMSLVENAQNTDSSGTILASTTVDYGTLGSGWYEVEIDWQSNDDIDVTLSKDGSVVASVSDNDPTYTGGGVGFTFWFQNGGWDNYTARPRVDTEPTVYFGDKQTDGGASWAADLDESYSYTQGDIARLRVAIENTGLQITGQTFDIEYAQKGAAPSCEAVSSGSYAIVPPQSSCGSSPLCMQASSFISDNGPTTDLLFEVEGEFTGGKVVEDPSNTTASLTIDQDEYTELEYAITPTSNATAPAYCLRVTDAGDPVDTYLSVAELGLRFDPVLTNVSINSGADISLLPGATTTVYATGTVTDINGYLDLLNATSTMYRSGVGPACSLDNNNCYISTAPLCSFENCAGNSCTVSCSADFYFHADATDSGSTYDGEEWMVAIEVSDQAGGIDLESNPLGTEVEVNTLHALDVDSAINYGSLAVSSTTGAFNPTTTIQNLGNVSIDIELEGTDLSDGGSSFIPASEQLFATSSFTYTACTACNALSSTTAIDLEVDLTKPTTVASPVTDVVYWGIEIPFGVASNPHQGTNIFYAVSD